MVSHGRNGVSSWGVGSGTFCPALWKMVVGWLGGVDGWCTLEQIHDGGGWLAGGG